MEKEEIINELKNKFNSLLTAYNDLNTSGTPDKIAFAWRWGSSTFILKKENADALVTIVKQNIQKELTDLEAEIKTLENG